MLDIITDTSGYIIRIFLSLLSIYIVWRCFSSMRKNIRKDKPLIVLYNTITQKYIPIIFWENSIGRSRNSDIVLKDPTVSRDHAVLLRRKEGWMISDTNSKAGVFVNGKKINERTPIYIDDKITIGSTQFVVQKYNGSKNKKYNQTKIKKTVSPFSLLFAVTIFQILEGLELSIAEGSFNYEPFLPIGTLIAISWTFLLITRFIFKRINFELETLAIFLSSIGIALLCGQDIKAVYTQIASMCIGIALFCLIIWFVKNLDRVMKFRIFIMIAAVALFALNLLIGTVQNGAQNWIMIGPFSFQPSELVKVAFIFVGASTLDYLQTTKNLTEFIVFSAICIGSLFLIGDFGTACIFFVTFLVISFMRSGDIRTIVLICAAAVFGAFIILKFKPYVANRFKAWGHVWDFADTLGYQQTRVLTYIASGGFFGVGLGKGNLKYVFASESDLIFGMIGEEIGLIMAILVAICIACLGFYSRKASSKSRSTFYYIASCSAASMLVFQMCLNIFGATDVLPLTGVTLPFISLGGSSMIAVWGLLAFIKVSDERTYAQKA